MTEPIKSTNPLGAIAGIAGAAGGWAFSQYCGSALWIPGGAVILLLVLFTKSPIHPQRFTGAIATTAAHVTWFIVAGVLTGMWSAIALDIILLSVGIVWLWLRPGIASALFLGGVQFVSIGINLQSLLSTPLGSADHRALAVHCAFRLAAIICLIAGCIQMRRQAATEQPATADVNESDE